MDSVWPEGDEQRQREQGRQAGGQAAPKQEVDPQKNAGESQKEDPENHPPDRSQFGPNKQWQEQHPISPPSEEGKDAPKEQASTETPLSEESETTAPAAGELETKATERFALPFGQGKQPDAKADPKEEPTDAVKESETAPSDEEARPTAPRQRRRKAPEKRSFKQDRFRSGIDPATGKSRMMRESQWQAIEQAQSQQADQTQRAQQHERDQGKTYQQLYKEEQQRSPQADLQRAVAGAQGPADAIAQTPATQPKSEPAGKGGEQPRRPATEERIAQAEKAAGDESAKERARVQADVAKTTQQPAAKPQEEIAKTGPKQETQAAQPGGGNIAPAITQLAVAMQNMGTKLDKIVTATEAAAKELSEIKGKLGWGG